MVGIRLLFLPDFIVGGTAGRIQANCEASAIEGHVTDVLLLTAG